VTFPEADVELPIVPLLSVVTTKLPLVVFQAVMVAPARWPFGEPSVGARFAKPRTALVPELLVTDVLPENT